MVEEASTWYINSLTHKASRALSTAVKVLGPVAENPNHQKQEKGVPAQNKIR